MTYQSTITSKGQTTVPKEIREQLKLKPGDEVSWTVSNGTVIMRARTGSILDIAGMFYDPARKPLSDEELENAIGDSMAARTMTALRRD